MSIRTMSLAAVAFAGFFAACEDQGPFERAGEEADEAIENARAGGETFENSLDDAADSIRDSVDDAADEIEEQADAIGQ